jgi:hypothetical protein
MGDEGLPRVLQRLWKSEELDIKPRAHLEPNLQKRLDHQELVIAHIDMAANSQRAACD